MTSNTEHIESTTPASCEHVATPCRLTKKERRALRESNRTHMRPSEQRLHDTREARAARESGSVNEPNTSTATTSSTSAPPVAIPAALSTSFKADIAHFDGEFHLRPYASPSSHCEGNYSFFYSLTRRDAIIIGLSPDAQQSREERAMSDWSCSNSDADTLSLSLSVPCPSAVPALDVLNAFGCIGSLSRFDKILLVDVNDASFDILRSLYEMGRPCAATVIYDATASSCAPHPLVPRDFFERALPDPHSASRMWRPRTLSPEYIMPYLRQVYSHYVHLLAGFAHSQLAGCFGFFEDTQAVIEAYSAGALSVDSSLLYKSRFPVGLGRIPWMDDYIDSLVDSAHVSSDVLHALDIVRDVERLDELVLGLQSQGAFQSLGVSREEMLNRVSRPISDLREVTEYVGIDSMLDAVRAGVPVADVLA